MLKRTLTWLSLALAACALPLEAQDIVGKCATPDSIAVRGAKRMSEQTVRTEGGLTLSTMTFTAIQRAIKSLYATGQFDQVDVVCDLGSVPGKVLSVYQLRERPLLGDVKIEGEKAMSERSLRDRVDMLPGRPLDPAQVTHARSRMDSLYEAAGYYLARITIDSTEQPDGRIALTYHVDEGRRLAISGIDIVGNQQVREKTIVKAMKTKPEGFWFFRKGEFDEDKYVGDLGERIPGLYARLGYVDARVSGDSLIVDRDRGKGLVHVEVEEGKRYRVGKFEIAGNRHLSTEDLKAYYPFGENGPSETLTERVKGLVTRAETAPEGVFDEARWEAAVEKVNERYRNEGYLYARIVPVVDRQIGADSQPVVNLRWEIDERTPAIINRIEVVGNDYTSEECIRRQIILVPGGVFNQAALIQSYQGISNMGFFETPLPFPDYRPINEQGDVDIVFRLKEKRSGSFNFGASMGQGGVGIGGFISVEHPNLFGLCKRGQLNWQYGRYYNDFTATYSDPALRGSRISGTLSAYRTQSKFVIGNLGSSLRTGSQFRLGFPVPWSYRSTFGVAYNGEAASFANGTLSTGCTKNCFRSNIQLDYTTDTRYDLPFATGGSLRSITTDFSGGPLGGTVNFQRISGEFRAYAPVAQLGGSTPGSQPVKFVLGMTAKSGALFGNSGPFFFQQQFAVGGVQYGQMLRGYPEFSITPKGFNPSTDQYRSDTSSFGNAFLTVSGEFGMRLNQMFYMNVFAEAGNNWASARQINPTRMFRSAGFGVSTVTPLGPLGLDLAYGFDRIAVDPITRAIKPDPRWQFHFRLGQLF